MRFSRVILNSVRRERRARGGFARANQFQKRSSCSQICNRRAPRPPLCCVCVSDVLLILFVWRACRWEYGKKKSPWPDLPWDYAADFTGRLLDNRTAGLDRVWGHAQFRDTNKCLEETDGQFSSHTCKKKKKNTIKAAFTMFCSKLRTTIFHSVPSSLDSSGRQCFWPN